MANVGQAQANAQLVRDLILWANLPPGSRLLFAGAGPGQMFEHVDSAFLHPFHVTFTDISPKFTARLAERVCEAGLYEFEVVLDDIEDTKLKGPFDAAVIVLVLEHVDWRRALREMVSLGVSRFILIIQRNPPGMTTPTTFGRERPGTLNNLKYGDRSHLIDQAELVEDLASLGFDLVHEDYRAVADGKTMCGLVFSSRNS